MERPRRAAPHRGRFLVKGLEAAIKEMQTIGRGLEAATKGLEAATRGLETVIERTAPTRT